MRDLVWFRGKDLRLADHPAVAEAGPDAVHLFVLDPYFFEPSRARELPHRMQFLLDSLEELESSIAALGGRLWCVAGRSQDIVPRVSRLLGVRRVLAMRWTEPFGRKRDDLIAEALDCPFELLEGETLLSPGSVQTKAGRPYSVFTPFNRSFRSALEMRGVPAVHGTPARFTPLGSLPEGLTTAEIPSLDSMGIPRNSGLQRGGEKSAHKRLGDFLSGSAKDYRELRERMDKDGSSRLSADIKFGLLSIWTVWKAVMGSNLPDVQKRKFTDELIWREFNYNTLWTRPDVLHSPFRETWAGFPWADNTAHWEAWAYGQTGYPIVDAAARELLAAGYVHNRARMIAASFLTKHLMMDYRLGEAHYMRWLTDGDWAQNNMGWQWAAGCGADAQPWFRVFNPMTQGRKFDPTGAYVQRWVPELAGLSPKFIHAPWEAPEMVRRWAGIRLGETYPFPIVDHKSAREAFLAVARNHTSRVEATS